MFSLCSLQAEAEAKRNWEAAEEAKRLKKEEEEQQRKEEEEEVGC